MWNARSAGPVWRQKISSESDGLTREKLVVISARRLSNTFTKSDVGLRLVSAVNRLTGKYGAVRTVRHTLV